MSIFRTVVAKQCEQSGCGRYRRRVGGHEGFCEECGQPLGPIMGWDVRRIALAIGGPLALLLLALAVLALRERLDARAAGALAAETRRQLDESRQALERGHQLAALRRFAEASREFRRAVESDPGNANAWANLGLAEAAAGDERQALDSYGRALQIEPENWLAHYNLGLLWARRGDADRAFRHLEDAFTALPDRASRERQLLEGDLRTTAPATLRRDPRFAALLAGPGEPAR